MRRFLGVGRRRRRSSAAVNPALEDTAADVRRHGYSTRLMHFLPLQTRLLRTTCMICATQVGITFWRRWEQVPTRCLLEKDQPCLAPQFQLSDMAARAWVTIWALGVAGCAIMCLASGRLQRAASAFVCAVWVLHLCSAENCTPPHIAYVTLALCYCAVAPEHGRPLCQRRVHDCACALRAALAVSYAFTGYAKLMTPAWRHGTAIRHLATAMALRPGLPAWVLALVSMASPLMCAATLAVECGLPLAELACELPQHRARRCTWLAPAANAARVLRLGSLQMHIGIFVLLPLTEVSTGMVAFHLALIDACAAADDAVLAAPSMASPAALEPELVTISTSPVMQEPALTPASTAPTAEVAAKQGPNKGRRRQVVWVVALALAPARCALHNYGNPSRLLSAFPPRLPEPHPSKLHLQRPPLLQAILTAAALLSKALLPYPATDFEWCPCADEPPQLHG